jgi:hypothetical protein
MNYEKIPDNISCTSVPQQWNVPRGRKVKPASVTQLTVARPHEERKPVMLSIDIKTKYVDIPFHPQYL